MKFFHRPRFPFKDTPRVRAAIPRRQQRERDSLPLFAPLIAETQGSIDEVMAEREVNWKRTQATQRHKRACDWINARRILKLMPDHERHAFLEYYYRTRYPLDPGYMLGVLRMALDGRLVMHEGRVESASHLAWMRDRDAKVAAMSNEELDRQIQQTPFDGWREVLRAERARRAAKP
jgi:hypothetical protein